MYKKIGTFVFISFLTIACVEKSASDWNWAADEYILKADIYICTSSVKTDILQYVNISHFTCFCLINYTWL